MTANARCPRWVRVADGESGRRATIGNVIPRMEGAADAPWKDDPTTGYGVGRNTQSTRRPVPGHGHPRAS